ncbi:MAG: hypothetical protein AAB885_03805, partial [Patescibacteria group bacterium]
LAQIMGGATGPLRAFMYLLLELAKKQPTEAKPAETAAPTAPVVAPTATAGETVEQKEVKNS